MYLVCRLCRGKTNIYAIAPYTRMENELTYVITSLLKDITGGQMLNVYAVKDNLVVGSLDLNGWEEEGGWISWFFVRQEYQGKGVGTAMLAEAERLAKAGGKKALGLTVETDNPKARALYERLGWVPTWTREKGCMYLTKHL